MNHNHQLYRDRRAALLGRMRAQSGGGLALVPTAPEVPRNRDSLFPYRHDSYSYYLSGFPEPEAVIVLDAGPDGDRQILFCREKNAEREIWDGFRYGPDAAREIFGFDAAHPISELDAMLPDLASDKAALYTPLGLFPSWDSADRRAAERSARPRPHGGERAGRDRRRAPGARRDAARQGCARARAHAPCRRHFVGRAPPGDGAHAAGLVRVPGRSRAGARIPARRGAGRRLLVDRRRRPQRLRAALPREQPPACATASSC